MAWAAVILSRPLNVRDTRPCVWTMISSCDLIPCTHYLDDVDINITLLMSDTLYDTSFLHIMDGNDPQGHRVGLLNKNHICLFLTDPFQHRRRSIFKLDDHFLVHLNVMIESFVSLDEHRA